MDERERFLTSILEHDNPAAELLLLALENASKSKFTYEELISAIDKEKLPLSVQQQITNEFADYRDDVWKYKEIESNDILWKDVKRRLILKGISQKGHINNQLEYSIWSADNEEVWNSLDFVDNFDKAIDVIVNYYERGKFRKKLSTYFQSDFEIDYFSHGRENKKVVPTPTTILSLFDSDKGYTQVV